MSVLLLRLAGPLQSWGASSRFQSRGTRREPTKSGVIGMLAAALGRRRNESVADLVALNFAVRADQPGTVLRDFQTAYASTAKVVESRKTGISDRYYLSDAVFVAAIEGDEAFVEQLATALEAPRFPLFLGRRSCPPEGQLVLGIEQGHGREVLRDADWQAAGWYRRTQPDPVQLELTYDAESDEVGDMVRDVPISFSSERREYGWRRVASEMVAMPNREGKPERDWLAALEVL